MAIPAGARLGPYEVLSAIGAGGMGEVYRARDSKLGRDVALKVLPPAFAADAERMARFEREARLLAALNHPNIAHIYGLEESSGTPALVMELVEGPTLAERVAAGPMALDEALPIARQIAEALEYAHERGVIHRDLKPANIKVTPEGTVKVLDFGLAKALTENPSAVDMNNSPTLSMGATVAGVILGTAAYMSPEQAKAKPADRRADIWAFGVVFCEMLTGKQLYSGETAAETLASVIKETPDLSVLPATTPPAIRSLIARCLDKEPRERLQHIGEARIAIAHAGEASAAPERTAAAPLRASKLPWVIAGALAIVAIAASWIAYRATRPVERASMYFTDDVGAEIAFRGVGGPAVALSPDASRVAYLARSASGITRISVRQLDGLKAVELAGTDRADAPFFSPDGRWIGFFVGGVLKKISVDGGAATTICETDGNPRGGGFWSEDGNIYIANMTTPVLRVPASGGKPAPVMPLGDGETTNRGAQVLPGGDAILFEASSDNNDWSAATIQVFDTRTKQRKTLVHGGFFPRYIHGADPLQGHLLYMQGGSIFAAPMDIRGRDLTGPALPVLQNVSGRIPNGLAHIAVSESGAMVYVSGAAISETDSLAWLDSAGNTQAVSAPPGAYLVVSLSPDGSRAALLVNVSGGIDVYVLDLQSNRLTRLTFLKRVVLSRPVWTPDGKHIAFAMASAELNGPGLYWIRSDGGAEPQLLLAGQNAYPGSFTPDEKRLVYREFQGTESAIWTLPLDTADPEHPKPGKPELFLRSQTALIQNPVLSPDGRWLAYTSGDSSSTNEVFVRPFTRPGGQWQVSTSGGLQPRWSQNAHELAYLGGADGRQIMMASYDAKGDSFSAGQPRLFGGSEKGAGVFAPATGFDISSDGKRILGMLPVSGAAAGPETHISFLINYADELRRKVPADK